MNLLSDPRAREAEGLDYYAEHEAQRRNVGTAQAAWLRAAELWAAVALAGGDYMPLVRGDLAIAACVCYHRAGRRDLADGFARHALTSGHAIGMRGRAELAFMLEAQPTALHVDDLRAGEPCRWFRTAEDALAHAARSVPYGYQDAHRGVDRWVVAWRPRGGAPEPWDDPEIIGGE